MCMSQIYHEKQQSQLIGLTAVFVIQHFFTFALCVCVCVFKQRHFVKLMIVRGCAEKRKQHFAVSK